MYFSWWCGNNSPRGWKVGFVEVLDANLVLDRIHGGVVHDVLDTLLLDLLEKLASIGGGGKLFNRDYKHELVLDILDGQRFDEDSLDGG